MNASTYLQPKSQRKLMGLAGVVVLHALLFAALQAGLHLTVAQKLPNVVQALLLEEKRSELPPLAPPKPPPSPVPPPKAPPPNNTPPTPTPVPPAEVPALVASPQAIAAVTALSVPVAAPVAAPPAPPTAPAAPRAAPPTRTSAGVNMAQCDKPEYPIASKRMEEEGTVRLRFLVGVDGKVIQSEIEKSSGYKRLDEAARAGLSKCQFRPAMVDGKPEPGWATMPYVWRLD